MNPPPRDLKGRTALVTGSTRRGIGSTTAIMLAYRGANLVLNYGTGGGGEKAAERAEILRAKIEQRTGATAIVIESSPHSEIDARRMFDEARTRFGTVDILVNSAGGLWMEQDFAEISDEHWEQTLRPEIDGAFYCIREALPDMRARRWGRIINVGVDVDTLMLVVNAHYGHVLERYPFDFHIAKTAKCEISHTLALIELKQGITINNVLPGVIENIENDEVFHAIEESARASAWFSPLDVADAVAFLCSEAAGGITGSDVRLPGNVYKRL